MRIIEHKEKDNPGFGVYGDWGETDVRVLTGCIDEVGPYTHDPLHFHKERVTYFLVQEGMGTIEIEGKEYEFRPGVLYEIAPREKYRVVGVVESPFKWIVIGTNNDRLDRVVC
jgi:mannose-6-phosphate isomerase-like protein (cupin superfamily)